MRPPAGAGIERTEVGLDASHPRTLRQQTRVLLGDALDEAARPLELRERGTVLHVGEGIARVGGLPRAQSEELLRFADGTVGIVMNLDPDEIGVVLLGAGRHIRAGSSVRRLHRVADVAVGEGLLGRLIDAAGNVLDGGPPIRTTMRLPIERAAPAILDRAPVSVPLQTGIKVVDALVPIGRGQRELIVGDRQTGKTTLAVDALIEQQRRDVIGVYCAIGQRGTSVARVVDALREHEALDGCIVVHAAGDDPPGLQFVTPYAAFSIAEYFMERGRDALVVLDDLTHHARAYRQLSLLLRRPPGREAYPGDIFFVHARLLERATQLTEARGGGSLTALPIVETEEQNITGYIPTNLISITDGQVYLSPDLYRRGMLPAVDVGRSVSRVGGKAQLPAYRAVTGALRLVYSQFEELEAFARFETRLDTVTRDTIDRGRRVREVLKQSSFDRLEPIRQIGILLAAIEGVFDTVPVARMTEAERDVRDALSDATCELGSVIERGDPLSDEALRRLLDASRRAAARFSDQPGRSA